VDDKYGTKNACRWAATHIAYVDEKQRSTNSLRSSSSSELVVSEPSSSVSDSPMYTHVVVKITCSS